MNTHYSRQIFALAAQLAGAESAIKAIHVMMGFDAFIDESIRIVAERSSPESSGRWGRDGWIPAHGLLGRWDACQAARPISAKPASSCQGCHNCNDGNCCLRGGSYCDKPNKSVATDDRFNAGLLAGLLLGVEPAGRLLLGCASSGYYVRNAESATWPQLIQFLRQWATDGEID